jgi:hypothetical protein
MTGISKSGNPANTTSVSLAAFKDAMRLPRSGQFYLLDTPLKNPDVKNAFNQIASALENETKTFLRARGLARRSIPFLELSEARVNVPTERFGAVSVDTRLSLLAKSFVREPLLAPGAGLFEIRFAHVLLLEMTVSPVKAKHSASYLFVYRELADDPLEHGLASSCSEIPSPAFVEQFVKPPASGSTTDPSRIEQMSMRMMASSRGEIRRKVIDAYDVEATTSSLGLHRTIAGAMTLAVPHGTRNRMVSVSPHRQRVRSGTSRASLGEVIRWACECAAGFSASSQVTQSSSAFLAQCAQPAPRLLEKMPSSLLIERRALSKAIEDHTNSTGQKWVRHKSTPPAWTSLDDVLDAITDMIVLDDSPKDSAGNTITIDSTVSEAFYDANALIPGLQKTDMLRVKVSSRLCKIVLPKAVGSLSTGTKEAVAIALDEFINRSKDFRVVLDNGRVLFCSEGAYSSSNLTLATTQLARIFRSVPALGNVHSEKGETSGSTTFWDLTSSFHVIETDPQLADPDSMLICDDSSVEWADYIELDAQTPRIRWLHAKVQQIELEADRLARKAMTPPGPKKTQPVSSQPSLSASALEEVVGQAIKNLARLRIASTDTEFPARHTTWVSKNCNMPHKSGIPRMRRLGKLKTVDIARHFDTTAADPLAVYEVAIVVPNYSKKHLEAELADISKGTASASVLQAFWLLSGFMHACLEVGAKPLVFMHD